MYSCTLDPLARTPTSLLFEEVERLISNLARPRASKPLNWAPAARLSTTETCTVPVVNVPSTVSPKLPPVICTRSSETLADAEAVAANRMLPPFPAAPLSETTVSATKSEAGPFGRKSMPNPKLSAFNARIRHFSTRRVPALLNSMPAEPPKPDPGGGPSISRPRKVTMSVDATLTVIPLLPAARTPAVPASHEMMIDLVIVTALKLPASMQSIWPPAAVFEIAVAKLAQG